MAVAFDPKQYWNDRLTEHYDLIGVGDISLTMNYNKWSYKVTRTILKRLLKKYTGARSGQVLDIGSGTGFAVEILQGLNKQVIGIDISSAAVKNLTQRFPKQQFFEIDAGKEALPVTDNSLQAVTAASVLYHVVDDASLIRLLKSVHQKLEPNGVFIFSENFIRKQNFIIAHQKCRTLEQYETILQQEGFKIISRVPNYVLLNDPVDSQGKYLPIFWDKIVMYAKRWKWFDAIVWPVLYPVEILLTLILKESPAQEFMICKAVK